MICEWARERFDPSLKDQWHCMFRHESRKYHAIIAYLDEDKSYVWWLRERRPGDDSVLSYVIAFGDEPSLDDAMGECTRAIHRLTGYVPEDAEE